jgi:DNA-binding PadR family transcriptional regulator
MPPDPNDQVPLTPAIFHIMLALAGKELHGYGIMQEVAELTSGQTQLGPGTLYRSIQRMLIDGFILERESAGVAEGGPHRRRIYQLSDQGLRVARAEAKRLTVLVEAARGRRLLPTGKRLGGGGWKVGRSRNG